MDGRLYKWTAAPLLLVLLVLILVSFNRTVGGFNDFLLSSHMHYWNQQKVDPASGDLLKMEQFYQTAASYVPNDPSLLQLGGHLSEWKAYAAADDEERRQLFTESLIRYRASIHERPTWPYTWFDLAKAKIRASEIDAEFQTALINTVRLGPNERKLQIGVVQLGMLTWESLDEQTQDKVLGVVNIVLNRNPKTLYRAVESYGRLDLLCSVVTGNDWLENECSNV
ncbi:MAG: hypothetical protein KBT50_01190 [Cycloclasticus sp.]|nr:hypothetical protein [Cycloclasticus sp.]